MKYYALQGKEHFAIYETSRFLMRRDEDGNWAEVYIDKKIIQNVESSYNKSLDKNISDGFWVETEPVSEENFKIHEGKYDTSFAR